MRELQYLLETVRANEAGRALTLSAGRIGFRSRGQDELIVAFPANRAGNASGNQCFFSFFIPAIPEDLLAGF
jgi:hypothetical protein